MGANRAILFEAGPESWTKGKRLYTGIRTADDRVLLKWAVGGTEFYKLDEDPYQLNGKTDGSETTKERRALQKRLMKLKDCAGATCR